ncbi:MAG TPA: hypothetical protein VHT97_06915 [Acidimicrobiales bacterium]|jgi:hypothetical protein|nr:hypothetical protein [Acidimicrobiales bacterium]
MITDGVGAKEHVQRIRRASILVPATVFAGHAQVLPGTTAASPPPWGTIIVVGTGAAALVVVLARWACWGGDASTRPALDQRLGPANWSFSDSWASTLTAFGSVLGMILLSAVLPEDGRYASARSVALVDLLFGFLVVLAPFVYNATSVPVKSVAGPDAPPEVSYEGTTLTFLVASALTLWAALGQVATVALIAAELAPRGATFYLFAAVLAVVMVLMILYAWRSIRWVLEVQSEHEARARARPADVARARRPVWTLL